MTPKSLVLRERARQDVDEFVRYYLTEAGEAVSLGFIGALDAAFSLIREHPASGSPRYGSLLGIPGLRHYSIGRFPQLIFYVELESEIEIWRILHGARDIPNWILNLED